MCPQAEKEELETSLQRAKEELKQAERALALSRDEVQHQTLRAQHGMTLATQQIQPLELQVRLLVSFAFMSSCIPDLSY